MQELGKRLKQLRQERKLSLRALARKAHLSHSFIADIEAGRSKPSVDTLNILAEALGIPASELIGNQAVGQTRSQSSPASQQSPDPSTPAWWYRDTPPTDVELEQFLKEANVWFYGRPLTDEDKEDLMDYLRWKWEKEKRRRERDAQKDQ